MSESPNEVRNKRLAAIDRELELIGKECARLRPFVKEVAELEENDPDVIDLRVWRALAGLREVNDNLSIGELSEEEFLEFSEQFLLLQRAFLRRTRELVAESHGVEIVEMLKIVDLADCGDECERT